MSVARINTPLGEMLLSASDEALTGACFVEQASSFFPGKNCAQNCELRTEKDKAELHPLLRLALEELTAYFSGRLFSFSLPLRAEGTPFQQRIWQALVTVALGTTISYGELAERAGCAGSFRATGGAVGKNPIAIIIPCHRIIGRNGTLTGYGGGLERKRFLLNLENGCQAGVSPGVGMPVR